MRFNVFRRSDTALVIVPALFQSPLAIEVEGQLRRLGTAYVELDSLSDDLVRHIGLTGYAVATGADEALLRVATERGPFAGDGAAPIGDAREAVG